MRKKVISKQSPIRSRGTRSSSLNGFNLIRAKQKLLRRRKRVQESFSRRRKRRKSFTLTIHSNLANPVKSCHGIIELLHLIDLRRIVLLKKAVRRIKEGTSAVLLQSGLDEKWWANSMECYCHLRNVQDLLADWKNSLGKAIRRTIKRPSDSFRCNGWISSDFFTWPVKAPPIWQESLPGIFLGYALIARRIWKGDVLVADIEELENMDA